MPQQMILASIQATNDLAEVKSAESVFGHHAGSRLIAQNIVM
jgi:hypothetical protein